MTARTPLAAWLPLVALIALGAPPHVRAAGKAGKEALPLDALVFTGSHNSYHKRPLIALHPRHRYGHDPLFVQLEHHGVRAMELDLHLDRSGEYEVYHIAVIDQRTHCKSFLRCLGEIRAWSDLNRDHEPLLIWLEIKDFSGGRKIESARPVDALLRAAFGDRLITPDDLKGAHASVREGLLAEGWPTLAESRGKLLFMLTGSPEHLRDYTFGLRHLDGRVMLPEAKPEHFGMPWAAVAKLGARSPVELIGRARAERLLLNTTVCAAEMKDAECFLARDSALAAGFNVLLDDYVRPTPERAYFLDVDFSHVARGAAVTTPQPRQGAASEAVRHTDAPTTDSHGTAVAPAPPPPAHPLRH